MKGDLTPAQLLVDRVRAYLGKRPLYAAMGRATDGIACGGYLSKEALCRLAQAECTRCGGSGYYDGWELEQRCPCTGLPPKGKRGSGAHPDTRRDLFRPRHAQRAHQQQE